jgi:hypothetical protein
LLCNDLWVKDRDLPQINIVLTDMDDESNGFSSVVGEKIELFAAPMLSITTGGLSWIDRVVVHELAHQVTYFALRRALGVYSTAYYTFFLPTWLVEGIAQFEAESWDGNREFLLRSAYNKFQFLDEEHLYGYMGTDYIGARLLYEEGHSLYRFLVRNHGRDIGGRILSKMRIVPPTLDHALKNTIGVDQSTLLFNWRLMLEKDYPLSGSGGRTGNAAQDVNAALGRRFAQVYSLKRVGDGFVFTGIERSDVFEKNLYAWFPAGGLKKLDGPDAGTFFTLLSDSQHVCYSVTRRDILTGAFLNKLYLSDLHGRTRALNGLKGEEPCALPDNRIFFLRRRAGFTQAYTCDARGKDVREAPLPPSVPQAYRPLFAGGRVYLSIIDLQGERKAASMTPDGKDFRIEVEKIGADVRFPSMNARGELAYASNEEGPFNIYIRATAGGVRKVTADPYGVFAPDFDGSQDSILVTALRDDAENFNLSVFAVSIAEEKTGEKWNMDLDWKKAVGFDRSLVSDSLEENEGGKASPYYGLLHLTPVLLYPSLFINGKYSLQAELTDPVGRHDALVGVIFQGGARGPGVMAEYTSHVLYPDVNLSYLRYSVFSDVDYGGGWLASREKMRDVFDASLSFPVNWPGSLNTGQAFMLGASFTRNIYRDSIHNWGVLPEWTRNEVPLEFGWSISEITPYSGNFTHPLDAFALSANLSIADKSWGSEFRYKHLGLDYRQSVEILKTYQTLYLHARAGSFLGPSDFVLDPDANAIPRGKSAGDFGVMQRYASAKAEYRIPLLDDMGFPVLGFYFERFVFGPFVDGFAFNAPGVELRDFRKRAETSWTAGLQGRQRIYFMGKVALNMEVVFFYNKEKSNPYGITVDFAGESGF